MRVQIWGARDSVPTPGSGTVRHGGTACVSVCTESGKLLIFDAGSDIRHLGRELMDQAGSEPIVGARRGREAAPALPPRSGLQR